MAMASHRGQSSSLVWWSRLLLPNNSDHHHHMEKKKVRAGIYPNFNFHGNKSVTQGFLTPTREVIVYQETAEQVWLNLSLGLLKCFSFVMSFFKRHAMYHFEFPFLNVHCNVIGLFILVSCSCIKWCI